MRIASPHPSAADNELVAAARALPAELLQARRGIYALDIGISALTGWVAFVLAVRAGSDGAWGSSLALSLLAAAALYRALAFIHELFHQPRMSGVRALWHAVAGVPLLMPLLLYLPIHQGHHNQHLYGTTKDGEYEQFQGRFWTMVARLLLMNLALPLALWVRFGLLTPLAAVAPVVRQHVIPRFVHMSLRMPFEAQALHARFRNEAAVVEWACAAVAWCLFGLAFWGHAGITIAWAGVLMVIATLNTLRAAGATHLYAEQAEGRDASGQYRDSINVVNGGWLTALMCPAGLQFHALHHLAPAIPYHHLRRAHRLLATSASAPLYLSSCVDDLWAGWRRASAGHAAPPASAPPQRTESSLGEQ